MKHLQLILAATASLALLAPAASAKTSVRQAETACVTAAKAVESVKTAKASDDGRVFTNSTAEIQMRITHQDGTRSRLICSVDRTTGEVTSLAAAE